MRQYDLEERTEKFAKDIVNFAQKIEKSAVTTSLINQLVKSGTSVGANYCEANGASSKKDFNNKIYICRKEANETKYWLSLIMKSFPKYKEDVKELLQEVKELTLIFSKINQTIKNSKISH